MIQYQDNLITALQEKLSSSTEQVTKTIIKNSPEFAENLKFFSEQISTLTSTEKAIYDCYVSGMSTKEVLAQRSIAEITLKYYNSNLYSKLGVSSRKQLLEYARAINAPDNDESVTK